jgi:hypothetical protein
MSESTPGVVILLAIRDGKGLSLYAYHPFLQRIPDRDKAYIDDLLKDLILRSRDFPDEIFQQLSNLSVGPVVTDAVGWVQPNEFSIEKSYPGFSCCI